MEMLIASVRRQWSLDDAGEVVVSAVVVRASLLLMTMVGVGWTSTTALRVRVCISGVRTTGGCSAFTCHGIDDDDDRVQKEGGTAGWLFLLPFLVTTNYLHTSTTECNT